MNEQRLGFWLGVLAAASFGLTLPMTRLALPYLEPVFLASGRSLLAGIIAALILILTRAPLIKRTDIKDLLIVAGGVVIGFPVLSATAMQTVPAAHGGVILGILPLATACIAVLVSAERPSVWFWLAGVAGAIVVILYSLGTDPCSADPSLRLSDCSPTPSEQPIWGISWGHGLLFLAVIAAAIGYAVGAVVSSRMPAWRVICWALVLSLPFTLSSSVIFYSDNIFTLSATAWGAFLYLALVSQLIGFFIWYKALALGGIAKVSQTQLLQPFVTILGAAVLLGEVIDSRTLVFAVLVISIVWLGRNARIN